MSHHETEPATHVLETLQWGHKRAVPDTALAAWGARAILNQHGEVDFLHDRQDAVGADEPRQRLLAHLRTEVKDSPWEKVRVLRLTGQMPDDCTATVHTDELVRIDVRPAGGYLYVAAWLLEGTGRGGDDAR